MLIAVAISGVALYFSKETKGIDYKVLDDARDRMIAAKRSASHQSTGHES
jgi:hypothetical protein